MEPRTAGQSAAQPQRLSIPTAFISAETRKAKPDKQPAEIRRLRWQRVYEERADRITVANDWSLPPANGERESLSRDPTANENLRKQKSEMSKSNCWQVVLQVFISPIVFAITTTLFFMAAADASQA